MILYASFSISLNSDLEIIIGDGIFPGVGVPAVAISGASAANTMISPFRQWKCLDRLKSQKLI